MSDDTSNPPLKRCSKCKQEYPATREYFYRANSGSKTLSLDSCCKACKSKVRNPQFWETQKEKERLAATNSRRCTKCKTTFPMTEFYFGLRYNHGHLAFEPKCRSCCCKIHNPNYWEERKDRITLENEGKKRCTQCGLVFPNTGEYFGRTSRGDGQFHSWCKECLKISQRERHIDPIIAPRERQQRRKHSRKRYATDPVYKSRQLAATSNWQHSEAGKASKRISKHHRRSIEFGAEGAHTADDVALQYKSQKGLCWHCGRELNGVFHVDHLIPLNKGGTNWPNNIVCSCEKCNLSKGAKLPQEWNGRLF